MTNYPNPFHPSDAPTTIAYKLSDDATVTMKIYTITGGLVLEKQFDAGADRRCCRPQRIPVERQERRRRVGGERRIHSRHRGEGRRRNHSHDAPQDGGRSMTAGEPGGSMKRNIDHQ